MSLEYGAIDDTFYFHFAANDTAGSGADGATPLCDVRLCGAAADAAPVYSPTPILLTHANYPAGCHEVAIVASVANGFVAGNTYAVFCTLAVDAQNPSGFVGKFKLDLQNVGSAESVTGAVGSVTGAVGSVTGAVGSVTGAVGSVAGNVGGSVASVVGAVGSVTGAVGSIGSGGIAAASFAANAITASIIADGAIDNATFAADVGSTAYATNIIALAADKAILNYDAPTKAELDAGLAALNNVSSAQVNTACDTALTDYDAPTKAELDSGLAGLTVPDAAGTAADLHAATNDLIAGLVVPDPAGTGAALLDAMGDLIDGLTVPDPAGTALGLHEVTNALVSQVIAIEDGDWKIEGTDPFTLTVYEKDTANILMGPKYLYTKAGGAVVAESDIVGQQLGTEL
jgi:hypothetical protein